MNGGVPFETLMVIIGSLVPVALVWFVIVYFCMTRFRQNPRSVTYLSLAILIQVLIFTLGIIQMLFPYDLLTGIVPPEWRMYVRQIIHGILTAAVWILIGLAVFSRRTDQYADLS